MEGAHGHKAGLGQVAGVGEALQNTKGLLLELCAWQPVDELGVDEVVQEVEDANKLFRGQREVL